MELLPFGGLTLMTTVSEEEFVKALLDESGKTRLECQTCGSSAFLVKAVVTTDLDISFGRHDQEAIIREMKPREAMLINVIECSTCKGSDYEIKYDEESK
jgi:hypothetical protein